MPTLRYVHVDEPYRVRLAEAPCPEPGEGERLLRARASLISTGSELRRYRRYPGYQAFSYPVTELGYSMVGEVEATGERYVAVQRHATHVVTPVEVDAVRTAVRVPDGLSDEEATFGPLLRSTLNWIGTAAIELEHSVAILGQGLVGALLLQAARLRSPRKVLATDCYPLRLELARQLGADAAIDAGSGDPVAAIRAATGGGGADVVIDTVGGAAVASFEQAVAACAPGGRIVLVGMHTAPLSIPPHTIFDKTIVGSNVGYDHAARVMRRGLELVASGRIRVAPLITHRFPFESVAAAYELLDQHPDQALGVILDWQPRSGAGS